MCRPGQLVDIAALSQCPESPGTAGRLCRLLEPGVNPPGELVDPVGNQTRARIVRGSWWTPRAFGPEPESPGKAGRPPGASETGVSREGELINTVGQQTRA